MDVFRDWVEKIAERGSAHKHRKTVLPSEMVSMRQGLSFGANYRAAYCMAVCPEGEDVIAIFLANRSLRGFKFDWARSDPIQDQVYSNQAFTHKLNEFGIVHEAEEYNGAWGEPNWGENGRVCTEVLPFFGKHLSFEEDNDLRRK